MATLTTSRLAIPYPDGTERVMDGDNAMAAIAGHLDDLAKSGVAYRITAGTLNSAALAANTGTQGAVTFPVGRFTQAPMVAVSHDSNGYTFAAGGGVTTSGMTARAYNPTGTATTGTGKITWIAVQMTSASAPG